MAVLAHIGNVQTVGVDQPICAEVLRPTLNKLRFLMMTCRASPRLRLSEACALLSGRGEVGACQYAEALLRCLREALGRNPVMHAPGEVGLSFDEAWLLRLIHCLQTGDNASFSFLIRARVPVAKHASVEFLVHGFAGKLESL